MKVYRVGLLVLLLLVAFVGVSLAAPHEITKWKDNKAGAISLTFDDGYISHFTIGVTALNDRGYKGTFFIISDLAETGDGGSKALWADWRNAAGMGHEIGSHSKSHPTLTNFDPLVPSQYARLLDEILGSKTVIESKIGTTFPGYKCNSFAYPEGTHNPAVEAVAQGVVNGAQGPTGYVGARAVPWGFNVPPYNYYATNADFLITTTASGSTLEREADQAMQEGKWLVVGFHRLDGGGNDPTAYDPITEARFNQFLDHLKNQNQNLWVGTFGSVVKYIKEQSVAVLTVDPSPPAGQIVLNLTYPSPTPAILTPSVADYDEPLTLRSEVPSDWNFVKVQQGSSVTTVKSVAAGGTRTAYYNAVPDRGQIILSKGKATLALPLIIK
jgi:peptidoglycan/xylan/chitin deacetylase (PgdA/CDA1 family)